MRASRRDVLKAGGIGALGAVGLSVMPGEGSVGAKSASDLPEALMPKPFRAGFVRAPVLRPYRSVRDRDGVWTDHYEVTERRGVLQVAPGVRTTVFGYEGIAPGPTIKLSHGRRALLRVRNHLPAVHPRLGQELTTSVHLHGSASLPQYDGYASDVTPPGFYKDYHYVNSQRARTLFYHDHAAHHTARNVYAGLYAQYHVHDRAERDLLPQGEYDVALTVTDAAFGTDGSLVFDDRSGSGAMGDVILVNGRPWPVMRVKRRVYRFRILATAASRSFRFALDNGDPMTVVATDGGLMPRARQVDRFRAATGERYEVLVDFRRYRPGQRVVLRNLSNDNNVDYDHTDKVMAFDVTDAPFSRRDGTWHRIPDLLEGSAVMRLREADATRSRRVVLDRTGGQWVINDRTWEDVIDSDFQLVSADPNRGAVEAWTIETKGGGWFHPAHLHLVDFKILSRDGRAPFDYERGPKDTVYVGENEAVRLVARFGPHRGRYMLHCHNLVHEDDDMMVQYGVGWKPGQPDPNDPILAAPPRVDNLPRRR
jgi:FtsP/CotA-like multicopper oxidase with cupredoxin domain